MRVLTIFLLTGTLFGQRIIYNQNLDKQGQEAAAAGKKLGVKVTDIYWTMGDHDGVLIFEAPDDETATTLLLHLGAQGNVHTTTVRAFTAAEMDKILTKVHAG